MCACSDNVGLRKMRIFVCFFGHNWGVLKVTGWRRRSCVLPLQPLCAPRVWSCDLSIFQRPEKIDKRKYVSHSQNRGSRCRHDVEELKFWWISMIASWHAKVANEKLR